MVHSKPVMQQYSIDRGWKSQKKVILINSKVYNTVH